MSEQIQPPARKLHKKGGVHEFIDTLLGNPLEILAENKLPTQKNILRRIRYLQQKNSRGESVNVTRKDMVKTVASEVLSIWQRADIDTVRIDKIEEKIHTLFGELDKLLKHWDRLKPDTAMTHQKCHGFS